MNKLVESVGITRFSKSQVSVMAQDLDAQVAEFRARPTEKVLPIVREQLRAAEGRNREPSAGIISSQSVKGVDTVGQDSRGYDAGKKINGRKRFIVTDTWGYRSPTGMRRRVPRPRRREDSLALDLPRDPGAVRVQETHTAGALPSAPQARCVG